MFAAPFEGPKQLVERSRKHASELADSVAAMAEKTEMGFVKGDFNDPLQTYYFVFSAEPTLDMSLMLRDSINCLRVALDISICDIARLADQNPKISAIKFPFAKDDVALEKRIEELQKAGIPNDLGVFIRAIHPLREPVNRWIRDLHDLDIASKHQTIIPVYSVAFGGPPVSLPDEHNDFVASMGFNFNAMRTPWHHGAQVSVRPGVDPASMMQNVGPLEIRMPYNLPFGGHSVTAVLATLADSMDMLISHFDDLFGPTGDPARRDIIRAQIGL